MNAPGDIPGRLTALAGIAQPSADDFTYLNYSARCLLMEASGELTRLYKRLGPVGLKIVLIDGDGHYVSQAVKAEIERLRAVRDAPLREALERLLPFLEDAETKALVGDEGCLWAVEVVRAALHPSVAEPPEWAEAIEAHVHELCCRVADDNPLKARIHALRDYLAAQRGNDK